GNPHIAWKDYVSENNYDIYYLKWNGTEWVDADGSGQESINVSNNDGYSGYPSLSLDSLDNPHIAWKDHTSGSKEIYYLKWNGTAWVDADGSAGRESINISNTVGESRNPSLCLDSSGNPHIAWDNYVSGNYEIYYLKWNGSAWVDTNGSSGKEAINVSNNRGNSGYPSLCLDSSDNPHIAWFDRTPGSPEIYYLKWNGTAWVDVDGVGKGSINISNTGGDSLVPSLYLDNGGNPHIAWRDNTIGNYDIYYLKWNLAPILSWTGETNYTSDGLNPEAGYPNNDFVFRVKYTDQNNDRPAAGYPKLHIRKGGLEISGSPLPMSEVDTGDKNYADGKLYTYTQSGLALGTDYTYYFEAKDIWNTLATGAPTSAKNAPDVINRAPTLSWTGEADYISDGLNPETGYSTTNFVYRVKYTDQDNEASASGYPKVHIIKGGLEIIGSPFAMGEVDAGDTTYNDGKLYTYPKSGLEPGTDYTYYFEAEDVWYASATGAPTSPHGGPDVAPFGNHVPGLSWTGETNYTSDGLEPQAGYPDTDFIYRVKYTDQDNDAPGSGYPKVHIMKGGSEISGSPFAMSELDAGATTYSDGKLYTCTKSGLGPGTDYTYYFEAKDLWNTPATGEPTSPQYAPDVTNNSPTLSWTKETNYISDGLNPEVGYPITDFVYRVKYADQDNDAPASGYPKVHIMKGGLEINGSPFAMVEVNAKDKNYSDGKLYTYTKSRLAPGMDYAYYFEGKDFWNDSATGAATSPVDAPNVEPIEFSGKGDVRIQGGENGYVNPLKGEVARIHFWPSGPGTVNVEIFDLIGLLVWEKSKDVSGAQDVIEWDCRNDKNDVVASGIYLVYVEGPGIKATKKAAVLK
ncbi:T9SS type A sorting domain-containing protein, partial [bacterium]|nr:T9SS type A sorting domain-containing protein [bacterium]